MGIIDEIKSIAGTIQKIGNIDLHKQILGLQAQVMDLLEENRNLKEENAALKKKMSIEGELSFRNDAYWLPKPNGKHDGPFCSNCWDTRSMLVRMHSTEDPGYKLCPHCKIGAKVSRVRN